MYGLSIAGTLVYVCARVFVSHHTQSHIWYLICMLAIDGCNGLAVWISFLLLKILYFAAINRLMITGVSRSKTHHATKLDTNTERQQQQQQQYQQKPYSMPRRVYLPKLKYTIHFGYYAAMRFRMTYKWVVEWVCLAFKASHNTNAKCTSNQLRFF